MNETIKLLKLEEIHEKTGIHITTLQRFCREGQLKAVKRARQWYVTPESFNAFFTPENEPSTDMHKG